MQTVQLPPEIAGTIAELRDQVRLLSDRAAGLAAELHAARAKNELLEGRIRNLESQGEPETGKDRDAGPVEKSKQAKGRSQ